MKSIISKIVIILSLALLFTGCPGAPETPAANIPDQAPVEKTLTEKIDQAQTSIDFEGAEIAEDAQVSKAITIKNLKLGGKSLTIKASGIQLQNVSNAIIIIDQQVGDGDVTLTGCTNITKLVVNGGGSNSIHIKNSKVASVEVKKDAVRVAVEGNSEVEALVVDAAATKIESEENIVIKSIAVAAGVDAITIKGGNIENIEVLPEPQSGEASEEKPQIIVDGNAQINNIDGTTDVTLTEEALASGASILKDVTPPQASFEDSTITFTSDGTIETTGSNNIPYYFEYVFKLTSRNKDFNALGYQIKIYKLKDDIKAYVYGNIMEQGIQALEYPGTEVTGKSITVQNMYDYTFVLLSAGFVKGEFNEERAALENPSYTREFDIEECGMPESLIFPESPYKPQVTVKGSSNGNEITITTNEVSSTVIIFKCEKDSKGEWTYSNKTLYSLDSNKEKTITFTDTYVTKNKEYAYHVQVDHYVTANYDEYFTGTPTGGLGEIELEATASTEGIVLKPRIIEKPENITLFYGIDRYLKDNHDAGETKFNNFIQEDKTIDSFVDYFVESDAEYEYSMYYNFWNQTEHWNYYPHWNTCIVKAKGGRGELKLDNATEIKTEYNSETKKFTFKTVPTLKVTNFNDISDYKWINFMYSYEYKPNNICTFDVGYNFMDTEYDIQCSYAGDYTYDKVYSVSLDYVNGISYHSVYRDGTVISGLVNINISE